MFYFQDFDMELSDERTRFKKLAYLITTDHGSCVDFLMDDFDSDDSDRYGFGFGYGFMDSDDEFELLCQGIKPWDPCAMGALAILNGW